MLQKRLRIPKKRMNYRATEVAKNLCYRIGICRSILLA